MIIITEELQQKLTVNIFQNYTNKIAIYFETVASKYLRLNFNHKRMKQNSKFQPEECLKNKNCS